MDVSKFYELGSAIKAHRESRGLVREDIALRIKISAKNLHAIEEGLPDKLPQPVFTRSFVRSYAQALEMDLEDVDRRLAEVFPSTVIDNIKPDLTTSARELSVGINTAPAPGKKIFLVIALLILALLAGGAWFYLRSGTGAGTDAGGEQAASNTQRNAVSGSSARQNSQTAVASATSSVTTGATTGSFQRRQEQTQASAAAGAEATEASRRGTTAVEPAAGAASSTSTASAAAAQSDGPQPTRTSASATSSAERPASAAASTGAPAASTQTAATAGTEPSATSAQTATASSQGANAASQTATADAPVQQPAATRVTAGTTVSQSNASAANPVAAGGHRVIISGVSGECWVGAKFDEIGERNVRLTPGRHFVLDFKERLTLTLGNAAAVRVSYDGRPFNYTAADGDVRVFRFPR